MTSTVANAPDRGVQPERERGGAFGSGTAPGLRLFAAEVLLGVAEGDLDRPAAGVTSRDLGAAGGQVGGDTQTWQPARARALNLTANRLSGTVLPMPPNRVTL